jgi:hypothetical protein
MRRPSNPSDGIVRPERRMNKAWWREPAQTHTVQLTPTKTAANRRRLATLLEYAAATAQAMSRQVPSINIGRREFMAASSCVLAPPHGDSTCSVPYRRDRGTLRHEWGMDPAIGRTIHSPLCSRDDRTQAVPIRYSVLSPNDEVQLRPAEQ